MNLVSTRHDYYIELLEELTRAPQCTSTNLVVCLPRADFLHHIVRQARRQSETATAEDAAEPHPTDNHDRESSRDDQAFMTPALRLLAASRAVNMIYCPTIPVLRAWLSTYTARADSASHSSTGGSHLIIVDALALHHGTSEFTLQGISRTLAAAVSAAHGAKSRLTLVECKDIQDPSNPDRGSRLWDQQMPLLNGSVKIGLERSRWAGQSMTVRKIAGRWFSFEDPRGARAMLDTEEMLI